MSSAPTASIASMVKQNEAYATAYAHARELAVTSEICSWHERQYRNSLRPSQHLQARTEIQEETQQAGEMELADEFATEAKFSLAMLREERRQKLRELYQAEARAYYEELAMLGLAPIPLV
mmetsp:Transcript_10438/g.23579  ORF Transcript_10438/g.23579 Transcript_10438/m.23579 type:complete len:121 (-) Transcript_10438:72-434(-)